MKTHRKSTSHDSDVSPPPLSDIAANQPMQAPATHALHAILLEAMDSFLLDIRKMKITLTALHLLIVLYHLKENTARLNKLAETIGVTSAGLTGVVDHLGRMGLAVRETDPLDRRAILTRLTPDGVTFAKLVGKSLASSLGKACVSRSMPIGQSGLDMSSLIARSGNRTLEASE